jgi:nitrite reductase/ring-hydroxylating ferredoxin subunit
MKHVNGAADDGCRGDCPVSRRDALRLAAGAALGALLAGGLAPAAAHALVATPRLVEGRRLARANVKRYPVPAADGVAFDKDAEVILVRHAGQVYAFNLSCPHQNTALKWVEDDGGRFQCPKHKSKYKVDGTFISGRATRNMDRLGIAKAGSEIEVNLDVLYKQDKQPAEWAAAVVTV